MKTLAGYGMWAMLGAAAVILLRGTATVDGDTAGKGSSTADARPPVVVTGGREPVSAAANGAGVPVTAERAAAEYSAADRAAALTRVGSGFADGDAIARLAQRLPAVDRAGFIADAIVRMAGENPAAAMAAALGQAGHWHRIDTVERIAAIWARSDPQAALAYARGAQFRESDIWQAFRGRVLASWAEANPDAALGYLLSPEGQQGLFVDGGGGYGLARRIAESRPEQLLVAAESLPPGTIRAALRGAAIESLVESDPVAALPETWPGPVDEDHRQWIDAVAALYPRRDPAAALDWARQLEAAPRTVDAVVRSVHEAYPARTLELGLCEIDRNIDPVCGR